MTKLRYQRGSVRRGDRFEVLVDILYDAGRSDRVVVPKNEWDIAALYHRAKEAVDSEPGNLQKRLEFEEMRLAYGEMITLKRQENLPMASREERDGRSEVVWKYEYPDAI